MARPKGNVIGFTMCSTFGNRFRIFIALLLTELKTVHRTVFLTLVRIPSDAIVPKKKAPFSRCFLFGPPEGIRTPVLQNRNLLRYPTAPRAEILSLPMKYTMFDVKSQGNQVGLFTSYNELSASFLLFLFDCDIIIIP